jgi:hypothetical protein
VEILLNVGEIYQIYTKYESIAGEKVMVVGTLAYSETVKVPYNIAILAINERVIAVSDEDLQEKIKEDTIYHCRAIDPKPDGTYAEYIVWDSIINREKTIQINKEYKYEINISIANSLNSPITQIISDLEKYIVKIYPDIAFSIVAKNSNVTTSSGTSIAETSAATNKDETLDKALAILEMFNKLENKLIPAADAIISADLINKTNKIIENYELISSNIQYISDNV